MRGLWHSCVRAGRASSSERVQSLCDPPHEACGHVLHHGSQHVHRPRLHREGLHPCRQRLCHDSPGEALVPQDDLHLLTAGHAAEAGPREGCSPSRTATAMVRAARTAASCGHGGNSRVVGAARTLRGGASALRSQSASDSTSNLRWPPAVRWQGTRPESAQRRMVGTLTPRIAAASLVVSVRRPGAR